LKTAFWNISFPGHASAKEIGLTRFGTRYYDPALGRWTQQDPVGGRLGDLNPANRYTYANDDPVNVVDPSGKGFWDCFWFGIDVIGLGFSATIFLSLFREKGDIL
jgi:RHS repeat-associated protein